jgi:hypothetical protein|tara:strand:+ start:268 stop:606 length:339 start_codon:yes stop_codon:yes gene_type:complete
MKENKLIAEFMGLATTDGVYYNHIVKEIDKQQSTLSLKKERYKSELTHFILLKYHTSWDWLMPVVQECRLESRCEYDTDDAWDKIHWALEECNIEEIYKAVVEFIKQHNKES